MEGFATKINWFPGHMKAATDALAGMRKRIDLLLEVVDARGIGISSNGELIERLKGKPLVRLALKSDLADLRGAPDGNDLVVGSKFQRDLRFILLKRLEAAVRDKTQKAIRKGLVKPNYSVAVVGLPNVGKSTAINVLARKNKAKAENRPGVTKSVSTVRLNGMFDLIDTPGILFKRIETFSAGAKLTLMGVIKPNVVPLDDVLAWGFGWMKTHYPELLEKYSCAPDSLADYATFLARLAARRNFVVARGAPDLGKAAQTFYADLADGKIGKISYDRQG